jgi:hypothetical protein
MLREDRLTRGDVIKTADGITADWLGAVLGAQGLELVGVEAIGTGQMSKSYRVRYCRPQGERESVVVKLAATDQNSRDVGINLGAYLREITFYRELRDRIDGAGTLARWHLAEQDPEEGWFTLVLEDIEDGVQGDQIAGCGPAEAQIAMVALARIHAPVFGDLALAATEWLNQPNPLNQALLTALLPGFLERYRGRIAPEHVEVCERFVAAADAWESDQRPPLGLVHGDYRLDNILFHKEGCTVVDWQTLGWGPVMRDAAYFIGGALPVEERRAHEAALLRSYYDELLAHGVAGFSWEQCREEYRRQCFLLLVMTIAPAMVVERTERGDDMFLAVLERGAQMAIDLNALELLPEPGADAKAPLRPQPADEGSHEPGPEPLWNESWYFDAVSDDGRLGVYHRIGRLPNADACLLTTCIVRPGEPAVMLVDGSAPLPPADDEAQAVVTERAKASHRCVRPLELFRVEVEGRAAAHGDHSAPLRKERGEPVDIALDLAWETDGEPYQWRLATRYEIPCRVRGTVRCGEETFELSGPGQRDHSWGARDWWAGDWMWSALHLDDGTHTHAVSVPTYPDFGVGYVQRDGRLTELANVSSTEQIARNGLIDTARITMSPGEVEVEVEPLAFGAILLEAPDGRISHFPRAMCRVLTTDGRRGLGWVEWNRNQKQA